MSNKTKIAWTERTFNPVTGCTKYSAGCANCYAETLTKRFPKAFPQRIQRHIASRTFGRAETRHQADYVLRMQHGRPLPQ